MLEELAGLYNVGVDQSAYEEELEANKRTRSLQRSHKSNTWGNISLANLNSQLKKRQIEATNRKSLYSYKRVPDNQISHCDNTAPASRNFFYVFEDVKTSVLAIVKHGKFAEECDGRGDFGLVLRDSNFYTEAGGQVGDQGTLEFDDGRVFDVKHAESAGNHVIHWGSFGEENDTPLKCGARLVCKIKADRRLGCSQHHTATHLIHKAFSDLAGEFFFIITRYFILFIYKIFYFFITRFFYYKIFYFFITRFFLLQDIFITRYFTLLQDVNLFHQMCLVNYCLCMYFFYINCYNKFI